MKVAVHAAGLVFLLGTLDAAYGVPAGFGTLSAPSAPGAYLIPLEATNVTLGDTLRAVRRKYELHSRKTAMDHGALLARKYMRPPYIPGSDVIPGLAAPPPEVPVSDVSAPLSRRQTPASRVDLFNSAQVAVNSRAVSTTDKWLGRWFNITYGVGQANGYLIEDRATFGGITATCNLGLVIDEGPNGGDQGLGNDGMIGFAFSRLSASGSKSWFEAAYFVGAFAKGVFSIYLNSQIGSNNGELAIGGVNTAHYTGNLIYVPVIDPSYWKINVRQVQWNGAGLTIASKAAVLDTGASLIVGPAADINLINQRIGGSPDSSGVWIVPCSYRTTKPPIRFALDNNAFITLTANDYILNDPAAGSNLCISAFYTINMPNFNFFIFGAPILRKYYSTYDLGIVSQGYKNSLVGIALAYPPSPGH
ncbi:hypothetical protein HK104_008577 [Borealophlyctis nickersoniae]|nr:hypothetical protein HK104_008577 [Borealophlyctis nickersoniae]